MTYAMDRTFDFITHETELSLSMNVTWIVKNLLLYVLILVESLEWAGFDVDALSLAPVYWNSSNALFKSSTNSPSIEVQLRDDIDLTCPYYPTPVTHLAHEYYIIYQVSKKEYKDCTLYPSDGASFMLMNCSAPDIKRRYTVIFEPFQSIPNVPEYYAGQTYYFITTSTGTIDGLSNQKHGACRKMNMKLAISVCCSSSTTRSAGSGLSSASPSQISTTNHNRIPTAQPPAFTTTRPQSLTTTLSRRSLSTSNNFSQPQPTQPSSENSNSHRGHSVSTTLSSLVSSTSSRTGSLLTSSYHQSSAAESHDSVCFTLFLTLLLQSCIQVYR